MRTRMPDWVEILLQGIIKNFILKQGVSSN